MASCVVMAMEEHLPRHDKTLLAVQLEATENYFLLIFTVELALKIIALGFILHPGSYLRWAHPSFCNLILLYRNVWNIMDFVVVVTGYITLLTPEGDAVGKMGAAGKEGAVGAPINLRILR